MGRFDGLIGMRRQELEEKARLEERQDRVVDEWKARLGEFLLPLEELGPRDYTRILLAIWEEVVHRYCRHMAIDGTQR